MIGFRNGQPVTYCDGCFRVRPTGEPGWTRERGIFDARPARLLKHKPTDALPPTVQQARQDAHACPSCATPYGTPLEPAA